MLTSHFSSYPVPTGFLWVVLIPPLGQSKQRTGTCDVLVAQYHQQYEKIIASKKGAYALPHTVYHWRKEVSSKSSSSVTRNELNLENILQTHRNNCKGSPRDLGTELEHKNILQGNETFIHF